MPEKERKAILEAQKKGRRAILGTRQELFGELGIIPGFSYDEEGRKVQEGATSITPVSEIEQKEIESALYGAINELNPLERLVIFKAYSTPEGLTSKDIQEIALQANVNPEIVETICQSAMEKLKNSPHIKKIK